MLVLPPTWPRPGEIRSCAPHASCSLSPFSRRPPWTIHTSGLRYLLRLVEDSPCLLLSFAVSNVACAVRRTPSPPTTSAARTSALEVDYDYDAITDALDRSKIELRPFNMWRYQEFLPLDGEPTVGRQVGGTPLVKSDRLAQALGVEHLWIKNDAVNFPTLSFKDRVVAVALSKAREFGLTTVGCASTGNLANSVAANAAAAGLQSYIFVPSDLERSKILGTSIFGAKVIGVKGTYDEVNRLCTQVAFKYGWGFVNINLRPFYAEGSKTFGFEMAEQLGWRTPRHVVCPMAGGSLIGKIQKAFNELHRTGLIAAPSCKFYGAQPTGCNPISAMV